MRQRLPDLTVTAAATNLWRLAMIRFVAIVGQVLGLIYAYRVLHADLHYPALTLSVISLAAINLVTLWRLRQPWPLTDIEYSAQLTVDILWLTVALYFSGGATNPFISYYLVPISISAAVLPWSYTWIISGACLGAYTLMLFFYHPLPALMPHSPQDHSGANLHVIGMWCNFAISAALITYFVVKMAGALRDQQQQLNRQREDDLRNEQIMAVATVAAGTAHELGTPLSTMAILLDDLVTEQAADPALQQDLLLLQQQLNNCRNILKKLVSTAEAHSHGKRERIAANLFIKSLLDYWQVIRPEALFHFSVTPTTAAPQLTVDSTLQQALINYLNNGADACAEPLDIDLQWDAKQITISIRDHGPGLSVELLNQLGKPFISNKGQGRGLGLFLSHATIDRYGGSVKLFTPHDGGTLVEICLPHSAGESP